MVVRSYKEVDDGMMTAKLTSLYSNLSTLTEYPSRTERYHIPVYRFSLYTLILICLLGSFMSIVSLELILQLVINRSNN